MTHGHQEPGTLASRLEAARQRRFVGRAPERELLAAALAADDPPFAVLHVHGPGGIGKSALLAEYRRLAVDAGRAVATVDVDQVATDPDLAVAQSVGDGAALTGRHVVLIDDVDRYATIEPWLREAFLPALPVGALAVLAGRASLSDAWRADAGWRDLLRSISLRNLGPDDTLAYVRGEGLPESVHEQVVELTHGHPLALSLLVDSIYRSGEPASIPQALRETPDLVQALLARLVDTTVDPRRRMGLQVLGHAEVTSEGVLGAVLGGEDGQEDTTAVFDWLRGLSFVEETPRGLRPHDVARDVLDADLYWRSPAAYAENHRRIRAHLTDRIRHGADDEAERHRVVAETLFLTRHHPVAGAYWEWSRLGKGFITPFLPADLPALVDLTRTLRGDAEADAVQHWLQRQPAAFRIFRDPDGSILGFAGYLALDQASERDIEADPGTRAMWAYAKRHSPPLPGECVKAWRFLLEKDRSDERQVQAAGTMLGIWHTLDILRRPATAWDFIGTYTALEYWEPFMTHMDFHHVPDADFTIGDRAHVVFAHDWRRVGVEDWLDLTAARELGEEAQPTDRTSVAATLSQEEFAGAVKEALRVLHRVDALAENPLTASALVRDALRESGEDPTPADVLHDLVIQAARSLQENPRTEHLFRVVDRTWIRPAPTQEKAAAILDLPFTTYRRHRDRGRELLTDWLWRRELRPSASRR